MDVLREYGLILVTLFNLFLGWAMWSMRAHHRQFATHNDLARTNTHLHHVETELKLVKQKLDHLPTAKDLNDMSGRISSLHADHRGLNEKIKGIEAQVAASNQSLRRIEDFLLKGGSQ